MFVYLDGARIHNAGDTGLLPRDNRNFTAPLHNLSSRNKAATNPKYHFPEQLLEPKQEGEFFLQSGQPLEQNKHTSIDLHVGKHLKKEMKTTLPTSEAFFYSLNMCLITEVFFWPQILFPQVATLFPPQTLQWEGQILLSFTCVANRHIPGSLAMDFPLF